MGWSSGMRLLADVWEELKPNLAANAEDRIALCEVLIERFENEDADDFESLYEIPEMHKALQNLHPDWEWDAEDNIDEDEEY